MKDVKKLLLVVVICGLAFITGCSKGNYKAGTYYGTTKYVYYGATNVATAVVYVDDSGQIKSVFLDSTYTADGVATTKKTLGDAYGMKTASANIGTIKDGAEWDEQIEVLENKIVAEQGLDWVKYTDDTNTKLDGLSGCTITVDPFISAVQAALAQAK